MSGKPSGPADRAEAAFTKSLQIGKPLTALELAHRFKLSPSTIYRKSWWQAVYPRKVKPVVPKKSAE